MTRIEVTTSDDMTEAHIQVPVPYGVYQTHVTFHMNDEEDVLREAAVQETAAFYCPSESDRRSIHAWYQEDGVTVSLIASVDRP
jgi:hypothetical protein